MKKFLIFVSVVAALFLLLLYAGRHGIWIRSDDLEDYLSKHDDFDQSAYAFFPELSELPEYTEISYYYARELSINQIEGARLEVTYSPETYAVEKAKLETTYTFYPLYVDNDTLYCRWPTEFTIGNYSFRTADLESSEFYDRQYAPVIGVNDAECSIIYLYFYDPMISSYSTEASIEILNRQGGIFGELMRLKGGVGERQIPRWDD